MHYRERFSRDFLHDFAADHQFDQPQFEAFRKLGNIAGKAHCDDVEQRLSIRSRQRWLDLQDAARGGVKKQDHGLALRPQEFFEMAFDGYRGVVARRGNPGRPAGRHVVRGPLGRAPGEPRLPHSSLVLVGSWAGRARIMTGRWGKPRQGGL